MIHIFRSTSFYGGMSNNRFAGSQYAPYQQQTSRESCVSFYDNNTDNTDNDEEEEGYTGSRQATEEEEEEEEDSTSTDREEPVQQISTMKRSLSSETEEDEKPFTKKQKPAATADFSNLYSSKAQNMMMKMGFQASKGLGKTSDGIREPIQASAQKGRRGLGYEITSVDLEHAAELWDPEKEILNIPEQVDWLINEEPDESLLGLAVEELEQGVQRGPKSHSIEKESQFCDPQILSKILECKTVFDSLKAEDMRRARTRSNPFETIRGNIFQNRAAVKMANMDAMFDHMFTSPVDEEGKSLVKDDLLYFADVCAGPGGFSEYVLYRKQWQAKGFGFTLKDENDFKLHDFYAGHPETFTPYYGVSEDGNVYDPENIESLEQLIKDETDEQGCYIMMADGGFSVDGQENIQEILSKQLYLAQCLVALSILRTKGHFVVKLFDIFTPFSVSLIYLMFKCFKRISVCKPNTSRPANSERYLVCKWKKPFTDNIKNFLFEINRELWKKKGDSHDVIELFDIDEIKKDEKFFNYIYESNNALGRNQVVGLLKIAAYCQDANLHELKQGEIRAKCLQLWNLPDENRRKNLLKNNDTYCAVMLGDKWSKEHKFMSSPEKLLGNKSHINNHFISVLDWFFVGIDDINTTGYRTFFMSKGRYEIFSYNMINNNWEPLKDKGCLEMSPNTLVYGELVKELISESRGQLSLQSLHIIDGVMLGGVDIRHLPLRDRNKMCEKFAKALTKPTQCRDMRVMPIRCKRLFKITDINMFFGILKARRMKDGLEKMGYDIPQTCSNSVATSTQSRFHIPRGLLFLNEVRSDKLRQFSKSQQKYYFFDKASKSSEYPEKLQPGDMFASFKNTFTTRVMWKFEIREQILPHVDNKRSEYLYRDEFIEALREKAHPFAGLCPSLFDDNLNF